MIEFTRKYANNDQACEDFFFHASILTVYYCEKCGCTHYKKISTRNHVYTCSKMWSSVMSVCRNNLQDCKLDLYKLLWLVYLLHFQQRCQCNGDAFSAGCKLQDCTTAVQKMQSINDRMQLREDT